MPCWGHDRYDISHSIISTTVGILVVIALLTCVKKIRVISTPMVIAGALAWYSHILLDTFYSHGIGLSILWPFGEMCVALPIPWFSTIQRDPILSVHNVRVALIEGLVYGLILAIAMLGKNWFVAFQTK